MTDLHVDENELVINLKSGDVQFNTKSKVVGKKKKLEETESVVYATDVLTQKLRKVKYRYLHRYMAKIFSLNQ